MKVICTNPGNQTEEGAAVTVGSIYTVIDWTYGGECGNYVKGMERFYQLAEMPEDKRFWSGLFSELDEAENSIGNTKNKANDQRLLYNKGMRIYTKFSNQLFPQCHDNKRRNANK